LATLTACALASAPRTAHTEPATLGVQEWISLDRAVIRWLSPETGGPANPQFIFERELAFEARLESLADPDVDPRAYRDRHVHAAMDRHIAESLLATLPITPPPDAETIVRRANEARAILEQRVHGADNLIEAAKAEGMGADDLSLLFKRKACASLYLDRMVAPMLDPTELELRALLRTGATPFKDLPYEQVAPALARWYVGERTAQAVEAFFQNARARAVVTVLHSQT
jgi:hypothetical protein